MTGKVLSSRNLPSYEDLEAEIAGLWDDIADMVENRVEAVTELLKFEHTLRHLDPMLFMLKQDEIADCIRELINHLNKV